MSERCNFVDPSTGATHREIIDNLQEEIAAQATQIYELTKVLLCAKRALREIMDDGITGDTARALQAAIAKAKGRS